MVFLYLQSIDLTEREDRVKEIAYLVSLLPIENYTLLRALVAHLLRIVQNAAVNKMSLRNVGIVFSPTLGVPAGVLSLMVAEFEYVFDIQNEVEESSVLEVSAESTKRNSVLYNGG